MGMEDVRKAVYAGSFDPPTKGHRWVAVQGSKLFDELVIAVARNPEKDPIFTVDERIGMLQKITKKQKNITVTSFEGKFAVRWAKSIGAQFMFRGVRDEEDYHNERRMQLINLGIEPEVLTVVVMPPPELGWIASSTVKGMVKLEGWENEVKKYLPSCVCKELFKKAQRHASTVA